jgi:tRNA pseudouridine55 synthase
LANDFGKALHSGGHLSELRRTKIGDYNVNKAIDPVVFAENLLGKLEKS